MATTNHIHISSYDIHPSKRAKLSSLMKYMQQAAGEDLANFNLSYETLAEIGLAFVLTKAKMVILEDIKKDDDIELFTWHKSTLRLTFTRDFLIKRNEKIVAKVTTEWILMNLATRFPARPNMLPKKIETLSLDTELSTVRAFEISGNTESAGEIEVKYSMLDENDHLNNTVYADIISDVIPELIDDRSVLSFEIHYKHEARLGDRLSMTKITGGNFCQITATNESSNQICFEALLEFRD